MPDAELLNRLDQIVAELRRLNLNLEQAEHRRQAEAQDERWMERLADAQERDDRERLGE